MKLSGKFWLLVVVIIYAIAVTFSYVSHEHNIYYWDFNSYWRSWYNISSELAIHPFLALDDIKRSISHDDYNLSSVLILSIFRILPVTPRISYILGISLFYLVPTVLTFSFLTREIGSIKKNGLLILSYILPLTFVAFWAPTLRGYPDICGLLFVIVVTIFCLKNNLSDKVDIIKAIKIGMLLWAPFLLRRWYAYTIIALYVTLPIINLFIYNSKLSAKAVRSVVLNFFISGVVSTVFAIIFQGSLIKRILSTNYSDIYSGYQRSLISSFYSLTHNVGSFFLTAAVMLSVTTLALGDKKQKIFIVFSWVNLILSFFLFTRIQSPGLQHNLPFSFWLLLVFSQGVFLIFERIKSNLVYIISLLILFAILFVIQINSLFDVISIKRVNELLPNKSLPLRVSNYSEYSALSNDLERLTRNGAKFSVFSSGKDLNDDMLNTISNDRLGSNLFYVSQVDSRDGFRLGSLMTEYVVVTNPVQTHLSQGQQRVITIPALDIYNHKDIGRAYTQIDREYKLNATVSAWIYKKNRQFRLEELDNFLSELYFYYPKWKGIYDGGLIYSYLTSNIVKGDVWGAFSMNENGSIFTHLGEKLPTTVEWKMKGIKKLAFTSVDNSCNLDDTINIELSSEGVQPIYISLKKRAQVISDVSNFQNIPPKLLITKNKSPSCDSVNISSSD